MTDGALRPAAGRLLVATPVIDDPNFERTVVLLFEHDDAVGSAGVVLNRPTDVPVADAIDGWGAAAAAPGVVFVGGPVADTAAIGVARRSAVPTEVAPWVRGAMQDLFGDLVVVDLAVDAAPVLPALTELRVWTGYSGWGAGQLRGELEAGAWWVVDADPAVVFCRNPSALWRDVLARQGGRFRVWAHAPDDPQVN
jgi:putative transcriptional regulator